MRHPSMVSRPALSKVQRPTGRDLHQLVCFRPRHMSQVRGLINRVFIWFFLFTKQSIPWPISYPSQMPLIYLFLSFKAGRETFPRTFQNFEFHTHTLFGHSGRLGIGWMVEQLWGLFIPSLPFMHARATCSFSASSFFTSYYDVHTYQATHATLLSRRFVSTHSFFTMKKKRKRKPSTKSRSPPES